jgi:MoxR-like ATPase
METNYLRDDELRPTTEALDGLRSVLERVLFGQELVVEHVLVGMLARGHILLEGLPGLGKTELVKGLARATGLQTRRIQFTPDLLPGDVTGTPVLVEDGGGRRLVFQPGPLFAQLVLADEINRASPKTQSALLEAMQERQVTVMGETRMLPEPFFVLATQNPVELEGTYPLPEAQLDRFLFKVDVRLDSVAVLERIVLEREMGIPPDVERVTDAAGVAAACALARRIFMPRAVASYIARLVHGTQPGGAVSGDDVRFGASPRAALALAAASKARALLHGRINAGFEDVRAVAPSVLRHRLVLDYRARVSGRTADQIVAELLSVVPVDGSGVPETLREARV